MRMDDLCRIFPIIIDSQPSHRKSFAHKSIVVVRISVSPLLFVRYSDAIARANANACIHGITYQQPVIYFLLKALRMFIIVWQ